MCSYIPQLETIPDTGLHVHMYMYMYFHRPTQDHPGMGTAYQDFMDTLTQGSTCTLYVYIHTCTYIFCKATLEPSWDGHSVYIHQDFMDTLAQGFACVYITLG